MKYQIIKLREHPGQIQDAAEWFHEKWGIPSETYLESIKQCVQKNSAVPQWYLVKDHDRIIAGAGVIENDFHNRKDLTPNVCAVYVEKDCRCLGIAGKLLAAIRADMQDKGVSTLYLLTDHNSFYERYGWEFLCMVRGNDEDKDSRMYVHY